MFDHRESFGRRLKVIDQKNVALANGYTTQMRDDGLIVLKPRRRVVEFPLKGLIVLVIGFFFFKAFILASIGPDTYGERIEILENGTLLEQGGAWVMQIDPISQTVANYVRPAFR
jgi:hypothetical protein